MLNKKRIAIFVGFICCLFFMTTFAGGTAQNTVVATRLVTFIDGYNNETISEQTINVGTDAEVPDDPSHQNLVFAGWYRYDNQDERVTDFTNILEDLRVIAKYAGDLNGNGIADDTETRYTVTFRDFDGSVLGTERVLPGMSATAPVVPVHAGRTFIGWQGDYTNVNRNVEVTATYRVDEVANGNQNEVVVPDTYYTVTFINGDTNEVIETVRVREGLTAQTPAIPEREGRVFDYWDGDYSNVTSDREVRLIYTDDLNGDGIRDYLETHYTIEFAILAYKGGVHGTLEGTLEGTLKYENLVAGLTVEVPTAIPENSNYHVEWRKLDGISSQVWTREDTVTVDGNAIYTVSFVPNNDQNNDGKADEEQYHTLTINYVSVGTKSNTTLDTVKIENVLAGTVVDVKRSFYGYDVNADQPETVTMLDEDTEVTIYYYVNGKDSNGNGKNDDEETYQLTINYVGVGNQSNTTLSTVKTFVVAGIEYEVELDIPGYTVKDNQPKVITMPEEDTEITIYYTPNGTDSNGNGKNDSEETYTLTITYIGKGTKSDTVLEVVTKSVMAGTEVDLAKEIKGYKADATQTLKITMPEEDKEVTVVYRPTGTDSNGNGKNDSEETYDLTIIRVSEGQKGTTELERTTTPTLEGTVVNLEKDIEGYTFANSEATFTMPNKASEVTVRYTVNGKDENENGKNDSEETYNLTIVRVSRGTKSNTELERTTAPTLAGTSVNLAKDIEGYTLAEQELSYTMPEKSVEVIVYYEVDGKDANHNGMNDRFEDSYTVKVNYVSVNSEGKVGENLDSVTVREDYVLDETYDITSLVNAKTTELSENYNYVTSDKAFVGTITAEIATEKVVTITVSYQPKEDKNNDGVIDSKQAEITFLDYDGREISKDLVTIGKTTPVPAEPTRTGYEFTGWTPEVDETVTEAKTYTATYVDRIAPEINADVIVYSDKNKNETAKINITVTDNVEVAEVRYVEGIKTVAEARTGSELTGNGSYIIDGIQRNGYYTIYAKDVNGNESIETVLVDGVEIPVGDFTDKYTTGTLGKLNGFILGGNDYSREIHIQTKEGVKIEEARIVTNKYQLFVGNTYATREQFEADPNFGTPLEHTDTTLDYTMHGVALDRVTIYVKYSYQKEVGYGKYETVYDAKLYKVRMAQLFGD